MSRDPKLCRAFVQVTKRLFSAHEEVSHEWSIDDDEDHCVLDIPKAVEDGFDIHIEVFPEEITFYCEGYHNHHELEGDPVDFVENFVGFLFDLLTPLMRVREFSAGGSPYKWNLECREGEKWVIEATTGLLFYNYFGRRVERIFQNSTLEERDEPLITH